MAKGNDGFTFANPGMMRVAKEVAVEGGVSDPRNSGKGPEVACAVSVMFGSRFFIHPL